MACGRPGGFSDSDSDEDDFFFDAPRKRVPYQASNDSQKNIEIDLQSAISRGDLTKVEQIIQTDLHNDVNKRLPSGWTALMYACLQAQEPIVEFLLELNADVNLHGDSVTPVMAACGGPSMPAAAMSAAAMSGGGAAADGGGGDGGDAAVRVVRRLLARGAVLNVGDKYGQTPLMRAVAAGRLALVEELLKEQAHHLNIEMRDMQGWTAVFWAVQNNQPEILELLIAHGARLEEVDRSGRDPCEIAESNGYMHISSLLSSHVTSHSDPEPPCYNIVTTWQDYYCINNTRLKYSREVHDLLFGMGCERLVPVLGGGGDGGGGGGDGADLRQFLLLDDADMTRLGVELPYERRRLRLGLKRFHTRGWKIDAVAGLYAQTQSYTVLDCLRTAGSHTQQACVLEASVLYALRDYRRLHRLLKFEPLDSPVLAVLDTQAAHILQNIRSIRNEIQLIQAELKKIGSINPRPADLVRPAPRASRTLRTASAVAAAAAALSLAALARCAWRAT